MSVFVVIWHMMGIERSDIFSQTNYHNHIFCFSDFLNFHLLLLAVPTFIFISIYLYSSKPINIFSLKKQLFRILVLLIFWPILFTLYQQGQQGLLVFFPSSLLHSVYIILRAGNTIYYFFSSLILCLIIIHFFIKLNKLSQILLFLTSIVLLSSLPLFTKSTEIYVLSAYWNPMNFIPISFAAAIFAKNKNYILEHKKRFFFASILLSTLFSVYEWNYTTGYVFFAGQGYAIPAYTRSSLVFSVVSIFILCLNPAIKRNETVKFMSSYSLSLYCLHPFLMQPLIKLSTSFTENVSISIPLSILLVILTSYIIAILLKKYFLKEKIIT